MKRKNAKKFKCVTESCWAMVGTEGRFCVACQAWWYRIVLKDAHDLALYVRRVQRFGGRLGILAARKHEGRKTAA